MLSTGLVSLRRLRIALLGPGCQILVWDNFLPLAASIQKNAPTRQGTAPPDNLLCGAEIQIFWIYALHTHICIDMHVPVQINK